MPTPGAPTLAEIDDVLIQYADSESPTAISFRIEGILSPIQVRQRITFLCDSPDWLTAAQQDQLVTLKMRRLIARLEEMTLTARVAEVLIRALEGLGTRLDKRVDATSRDLTQLYAFQGTVLLDAINAAMNHMKTRFVAIDAISADEWDMALEAGIRYAQLELSKHEAGSIPELDAIEP